MSAEFVRLIEELLLPLVLPFPRMLAALSIIPLFATRTMPMIVRVGLVLSFSAFLFPATLEAMPRGMTTKPMFWAIIFIKEVLLGTFLGFVFSLFIMALEALGSLIDTIVGNNNLFLFNPSLNQHTGPYSNLFSMFGTMYFISLGGLLFMIGGFYDSFAAWPVLSNSPEWSEVMRVFLLERSADLLVVMLQIAMPLLIMLTIIDFSLGLINRKASEIQVFVLSLPLKTVVAAGVLILTLMLINDPNGPLRGMFRAGTEFVRLIP